jgi:hypothetical protein
LSRHRRTARRAPQPLLLNAANLTHALPVAGAAHPFAAGLANHLAASHAPALRLPRGLKNNPRASYLKKLLRKFRTLVPKTVTWKNSYETSGPYPDFCPRRRVTRKNSAETSAGCPALMALLPYRCSRSRSRACSARSSIRSVKDGRLLNLSFFLPFLSRLSSSKLLHARRSRAFHAYLHLLFHRFYSAFRRGH